MTFKNKYDFVEKPAKYVYYSIIENSTFLERLFTFKKALLSIDFKSTLPLFPRPRPFPNVHRDAFSTDVSKWPDHKNHLSHYAWKIASHYSLGEGCETRHFFFTSYMYDYILRIFFKLVLSF